MARTKTKDINFLENHFKKIYDFEKLLIKYKINKISIVRVLWIRKHKLDYSLEEYNQDFNYDLLFEVQDFIMQNADYFSWTHKENNEIFLYLWENK